MANKYVDKIHKSLTKNKLIVIILILLGVTGTLYSFWPSENLTYEEQKSLMEESAKISAQAVIDTDLNEELYKKTGHNLTEILVIADEFKNKAKNDYDRGIASFNLKEYNNAIYFLNNSLKYNDNITNEIFYIGSAYVKLKEYDSAKNWLNKCSDNFQCLDHIGVIYAIEGDLNNSIDYQKKSLSILPNPGGFYNLGTLYAMQKTNESCEKAIYYFDESLKFSDEAWKIITQSSEQVYSGKSISKQNALFNKAYCLMNLNRLNESLLIFKEIEEQGRDDFQINYNLAVNYLKLKDYNNAMHHIIKSLNINPKDEGAQLLLQEITVQTQLNN